MRRFFICEKCGKVRALSEASRMGNGKIFCLSCNNEISYNVEAITKEEYENSCKNIEWFFRNDNYLKALETEEFLENL